MVEVINLRKCKDWGQPGDVLIDRRSKWGNVYPIGARFGNRDRVCELYKVWLKEQVKKGRLNIAELKNAKRLGCWCSPLACHGDILKKYIENGGLDEQEK